MNKSILLATIAVLLVAGCTQQGGNIQWPFQQVTTTTIGGTGMVISDFTADPTSVYSNSNARITMTVNNKGGAPVADDKSLIFLTGSAIKMDDTTGTYWHSSTESVYKHFGKTMNPEDIVRGTPADEKTLSWSLTAPNITKGQTRSDVFIGRVYYDYQTTVTGTIWVYSQSESDAARASNRALNKATFSSTSGPVALVVKASPDPIVVGENTFTMTIKVRNVGGGALYKTGGVVYTSGSENVELTTDELNKVNIAITAPGMTVGTGCTGDQELVGGKDLTLSCDITIDSPPTTFIGYPVTVTTNYGYNTERTATVTVSGR